MKRFAVLYPSMHLRRRARERVLGRGRARAAARCARAETYAADRTTFTPLVKSMVGKLYLDERAEYAGAGAKEIAEKEKDPFRRRKALEKARERLPPVTDFDAIFIPDFARNVKLIAPALAVEDVVTQTCEPGAREAREDSPAGPTCTPVQLLGANGWGGDPSLFDQSPGGAGRHVRCAIYVDGFFAGSARARDAALRRGVRSRSTPARRPPSSRRARYDAARDGARR